MTSLADFLQLDLAAMTVGCLAALGCGLLGNFLILRQQSLMGDAISHVVLPGIVAGFLITGTTHSLPMMLGAGAAALIAVGLIELIRHAGRVEAGAAMGLVFTTMFAGGVVLLEQSGARDVHIDVQHSLYGNIEGTIWLGPQTLSDLWDLEMLALLPEKLVRLLVVDAVIIAVIVVLFKEFKIAIFDAGLAQSLGYHPKGIGFVIVLLTAVAAVASFDAVGSILVIAMFICPAATARMLTDNLTTQIWLSGICALASGISGYVLAVFVPLWMYGDLAFNVAGMMAVSAGLMQGAAMLFAPRYGARAGRHVSVE